MKTFALAGALALLTTAAVAAPPENLSQVGRECFAKYPTENAAGFIARTECAANHPLAYQADDAQRAELNYARQLAAKLRSGQISYAEARAYLDQFVAWRQARVNAEMKRRRQVFESLQAAERWGQVSRYAEGVDFWQNVVRPSLSPRGW